MQVQIFIKKSVDNRVDSSVRINQPYVFTVLLLFQSQIV